MPSVYALGDPRTNEVRYIGIAKDVYRRYSQHLFNPHANGAKNTWMDEIKNAGLLPALTIIEADVDAADIFEREEYWIRYYREKGEPLTNASIPTRPLEVNAPLEEEPVKVQTHIELRIKEVAARKGITQSKLGRMADVDAKTLRRIFHDPCTSITLNLLSRLADALGVDASELIESVPNTKE